MRRGLTLIEILLVLAILVIIASIAAMNLNGLLDGQRLRKSGDIIHAEWAKARNRSMKTGRIHVFRCKLGVDEYEIRPYYAADDALESSDTAGTGQAGTGESAFDMQVKHLPPGVSFAEGLTEEDARSSSVNESLMGDGGEWGPPILFYADGTSSTARLLLTNRRQQFVKLDLRGLTGLTDVSDLLSQQEVTE